MNLSTLQALIDFLPVEPVQPSLAVYSSANKLYYLCMVKLNPALARLFLLAVIAAFLGTSCSVFRKKNRCVSCPKWNDQIELPRDQ